MNVLDLFSGIGGFSLGLERAGMRIVAFCEIDPYCRRVLAKHWPDVPIFDDVRTLTAARLAADGIGSSYSHNNGGRRQKRPQCNGTSSQSEFTASQRHYVDRFRIDVICGGFPCQNISFAGKGAGIEGERSGLWSEYARIIGEVRPRYVIVENVAALLGRGLSRVLGDLAALGFDAEWHCIPASAVGAPHRRDRIWIVAYADSGQLRHKPRRGNGTCWPNAAIVGHDGTQGTVADADKPRLEGRLRTSLRECAEERFAWAGGFQGWDEQRWFTESGMGRVAHGVSSRVDRLRSLGNAVVPQIPEIIGRAIMRQHGQQAQT